MKISRAFLVVVSLGRTFYQDSAEELRLLTTSDGLTPVGLMQAKRDKPDPATFLGSGKIEELGDLAREAGADIVVFDIALSAAQERNIERVLNLPVLDRTELILDIFRQRAKSREGRLQVELARLEHLRRASFAGGLTWSAREAVWAKRAARVKSRSNWTAA